jgi:hypothetical protein
LISNQYLFWSIQEQMRKPINPEDDLKKRADMSNYSETIERRIASLMRKIYGREEVEEVGAKVIRMTYNQRVLEKENVS